MIHCCLLRHRSGKKLFHPEYTLFVDRCFSQQDTHVSYIPPSTLLFSFDHSSHTLLDAIERRFCRMSFSKEEHQERLCIAKKRTGSSYQISMEPGPWNPFPSYVFILISCFLLTFEDPSQHFENLDGSGRKIRHVCIVCTCVLCWLCRMCACLCAVSLAHYVQTISLVLVFPS
jgi:hypothetical protein